MHVPPNHPVAGARSCRSRVRIHLRVAKFSTLLRAHGGLVNLTSYRNPIQVHRVVIERRDTTGYLPHHSLYLGEHRATCTDCMWGSPWGDTERDASACGAQHELWAPISPGDARCTQPRTTSAGSEP